MVDTYASSLRVIPANGINAKTVGNTKLFTTENGTRTFYAYQGSFNVGVLTGAVVTPAVVSVGTNAPNYDNIIGNTSVGGLGILDALTKMLVAPINNSVAVPPNTDVYMRVSTAAIGPSVYELNCNLVTYYR